MKELNKDTLKVLFSGNVIFNEIKDTFKKELLTQIGEKVIDLDVVDDQRVGNDFIKYLIKIKHIEIMKYLNDLLLYLNVLASLNDRRNITQSDLLMLTELNMNELGIDNWEQIINDSVRETMFRELNIYLDNNSEVKDVLTEKFEHNQITTEDKNQAEQIYKWLDKKITEIEGSVDQVLSGPQLVNKLDQNKVNTFYKDSVDMLLRKMKWQRLGFGIVLK